MTKKLVKDGNPVDKTSQRILQHLYAQDEAATSTELRDTCGVEHSQTISYRIAEHLSPANLVTWTEEDTTGAASSRRHYRLTDEGEDWVVDRLDAMARPADMAETVDAAVEAQSTADEAFKEARSAKESVQTYRKKLHRLKTRSTEDHQRIAELEDRLDEQTQTLQLVSSDAENAKKETDQLSGIVDELEQLVEEHDDRLGDLDDQLDGIESRVASVSTSLDDVEGTQRDISDRSQSIDERVRRLEQHTSQGILGRLRWLLFGGS